MTAVNLNRAALLRHFCTALFLLGWLLPLTAAGAQRVVSADGGVTEIIYALSAEQVLVGVDTTSRYPDAAKQLPQVGYRRTLTAEGILALAPDQVILTPEAGPATTLNQLQKGGIGIHRLPAINRAEDVADRIVQIAQWLDTPAQGQKLQQQFLRELQQVRNHHAVKAPTKVLFLLAAGPRGMMIAGQKTQAQIILDSLQLNNAAADIQGYKPLNQEAVMTLAPDAIIVAETDTGAFQLAQWPSLQATPAAKAQRVIVLDSMYLLGFGPRLPQALAEIQTQLTAKSP